MRTLTPIGPRVVIKRRQAETVSAGGIIMAGGSQEKPAEGEVVSVGCGYRKEDGTIIPLDVKVGDNVLFTKYSASEVDLEDDNEYIIIEESNILGTLS